MSQEWDAYLAPLSSGLENGIYRRVIQRNPFPDAMILYRPETDSTMEDIRFLARMGAPSGTAVAASFQRAGRGRGGEKGWSAPEGSSLLFSLLLSPADQVEPASSLPLRLALAVASLLQAEHGLDPAIKWPNDLLVGGRKICGILCETKGGEAFIGIGLNCNQEEFPGDLAGRATSIRMESGSAVAIPVLLPGLLAEMRSALVEPAWRNLVEARLYGRNRLVLVRRPLFAGPSDDRAVAESDTVTGRIRGIGEAGELLVETASGRLAALVGGEIGLP